MNKIEVVKIEHFAAQGEVMLERVDMKAPKGREAPSQDGRIIVGQSETGHHHWVDADATRARLVDGAHELEAYLEVKAEFVDLIHDRAWDRHKTLRIPRGVWRVTRQRESTPEGWERPVRD